MSNHYRNFLIPLFLIAALIVAGCGGGGGTLLKLSDIDPTLKECEETPLNGMDSVTYVVTGNDKYDKLFIDAAKISGTMKQMKFLIVSVKNDPNKFIRSTDNAKCTIQLVQYGLGAIPKMIETTQSLLGQLQALKPSDDFTGLEARKVPDAVSGISGSVQNLTAASKEFASILSELGVIKSQLK